MKLMCPQCGKKVSRKYKTFNRGSDYSLGGVDCMFIYSCKEHGELAKHEFDYVPDFEDTWVDVMMTNIKRLGLFGKLLIPTIIVAPFIVIGLLAGNIGMGVVLFCVSLMFGPILPLGLWTMAMFDHKEDMAKIREWDLQFSEENYINNKGE